MDQKVKDGIDVIAKYFEDDMIPTEITFDLTTFLFKVYSKVCDFEYIEPNQFLQYLNKDNFLNNTPNITRSVIMDAILIEIGNNLEKYVK